MVLKMDLQYVTDAARDTDDIDGSEGYASLHWSIGNIHKYYDVTSRLLMGLSIKIFEDPVMVVVSLWSI